MMTKQSYERLGVFYLGKQYDIDAGRLTDQLLLYDSKDLMTHAVCVGMTGSGKTGLCLDLLEEAAMDGVPAIVIDPKGDIGNLLLTFPQLSAEEFLPWVDEGVAMREGKTASQFAAAQADLWRKGLASWGQDGARIARLRETVDMAIYTPGGDAGLPVTVLKSFDAPPPQLLENQDAFRERVSSAASGLLALLGIDADPVRSREHILLSNILDKAWRAGRNLNLPMLIREIQSPPFETVGVMDLETFFPSSDRLQMAMTMNNLLASPSFASWMEGEPLSAQRLLYTPQGKPRVSILSIAHLSDAERMFFVTILLNEVLTWMRSQPGTSALRALLYMDEVFGYFPPTANPPSKQPMLTLLKQARAFGLGVVLATQNPVDLDYKGLSNTGTWFLGRLQTERDKARVLDGLEGASAQSGGEFDRARVEKILSSLGKRVFMMSNAHDDGPAIFQTRWAMSYLRGPLTRSQISQLMAARKSEASAAAPAAAPAGFAPAAKGFDQAPEPPPPAEAESPEPPAPPTLPKSVDQRFLAALRQPPASGKLVYRPAVLGECRLHYSRTTYKVDQWREAAFLAPVVDDDLDTLWDAGEPLKDPLDFERRPEENAQYADLPAVFTKAKSYSTLKTRMKSYLYRTQAATVWKCAELKKYSNPDEGEDVFRARLTQALREKRELTLEKLKKKYASKMATLQDRIKRAEERVGKESAQFQQKTLESALSFGSSLLGAMFGRKLASRTNVSRATTSMRSIGRAASERGDIQRAKQKLEEAQQKLAGLEAQFDEEMTAIEDEMVIENLELEPLTLAPKKTDITVTQVALVWTPWVVDSSGIAEPAY